MARVSSPVRLSPDARELADLLPTGRAVIGLSGAPGSGKSTLSGWLREHHGASVVPMDGFHYADVELRRRGLLERKGAPGTFDAEGYAALLRRIGEARPGDPPVLAPTFERDLEQPLAGALPVPAPPVGGGRLVVAEGNYLLLPEPRWAAVRERLDLVWHVHVDDHLRRERLVARHVEFGKSRGEAQAWVAEVDEPNAALAEAASSAADLVIDLSDWRPTG